MQIPILMSDQTLFKDRDVFESDYIPDTFQYRDTQLREMAHAIKPALFGARPHNIILRGIPGTGKTTSVRHIFSEIRETTRRIIPVHVNCKNDHTRFMVFSRIYKEIYGHLPPGSGISLRRLLDSVGRGLLDGHRVLLLCLDDANYMIPEGVLSDTLFSVLRLCEEFPGARSGVVLTVSNMDCDFRRELDAPVVSVMQPSEIYFPPYSEAEVRGILTRRLRQGVYPGVVPDDMLGSIVEKTMLSGDLRVGMDLVRRAVQNAEDAGRTVVEEKDVTTAFSVSQNIHLAATVRVLNKDEKRMLRRMAQYLMQEEQMNSRAVFASVREEVPMGYTLYFERLRKFDQMRLINLNAPKIRGNTREIALRFDAESVVEECGK
jgi:cell division control protein 6